MKHLTDEQVFSAYFERFNEPLQDPPLSYGQHCMTTRELVRYARAALREGRPIDWDEHLAPLPDDAVS